MSSEKDLQRLLKSMNPVLDATPYIFCTKSFNDTAQTKLDPLCTFREEEGLTMILERRQADQAGIRYNMVFSRITLNIHSSLEAVGFTSAVAAELTKNGIPANIVAAFYHDHLFIPFARAADCMQVLLQLKEKSGK